MKYINFLFHIYQPPLQDNAVVERIASQCYRPLSLLFADNKNLHLSLNVNYCLLEFFSRLAPDIIKNIRRAHSLGVLELTESGAYHPIFPLLPDTKISSQLELNKQGLTNLIGKDYAPEGIFPPEMAFAPHLAKVFKKLGYKWTIADDFSLTDFGIDVPYNKIYSCEGMPVFLRSNYWSNQFAHYRNQWPTPKDAVEELTTSINDWIGQDDGYLIISLDGETFGHHQPDLGPEYLGEMFSRLIEEDGFQLIQLSEIYRKFPTVPQFIPPSSWSMDEESVRHRDYFSLWRSPNNPIHKKQWAFTYYVLDKVNQIQEKKDVEDELNKALFSCQYWWASFWHFDPEMIYKGAFEQMRILQHVASFLGGNVGYRQIEEGEKLLAELVTEVEIRVRKESH